MSDVERGLWLEERTRQARIQRLAAAERRIREIKTRPGYGAKYGELYGVTSDGWWGDVFDRERVRERHGHEWAEAYDELKSARSDVAAFAEAA